MQPIKIGMKVAPNPAAIADAVNALAYRSYCELARARKAGRHIPSILSGGVRYQREPRDEEKWLTISQLFRQGHGDCEDLSAARIAEQWMAGDRNAHADVKVVNPTLIHIRMRRGDGTLEDPSRLLGMRGAG